MTEQKTGESKVKRCESCRAEVCDVRIEGEWVKCDWPPVAPVVDFRQMVVAMEGDYSELVDGEIRPAHLSFDGFPVPGARAAILVERHRCDAMTRRQQVMTDHGRREFAKAEAR